MKFKSVVNAIKEGKSMKFGPITNTTTNVTKYIVVNWGKVWKSDVFSIVLWSFILLYSANKIRSLSFEAGAKAYEQAELDTLGSLDLLK